MRTATQFLIDTSFSSRALATLMVLGLTSFYGSAQTNAVPKEKIEGFKEHLLPNSKWYQHDPDRPQPPIVTPGATLCQMAAPPSDAEVLFDGKDLSKWQSGRGQAANWKVQEGYMEVGASDIRTKGKWSDFQLHVEWASPTVITDARGQVLHGQSRGNSGILINNMYEVQVVDSYNDKTYPDGQAGAIYGQVPPLVNAAKPPGEWQTYDIVWEGPRWDDKNELIKKAYVTVLHNGVVVQNHTEFIGGTDGIGSTTWRSTVSYKKHDPDVFIELQSHNANPVRFRNIWIRELHMENQQ